MATWHTIGTKSINASIVSPPQISWDVEVSPTQVKPGQTVYVTVKVYANKSVPVRATATLFGQTKSASGQAYSTTTPAILTMKFTAPSKEGQYTGSVKLEAYY